MKFENYDLALITDEKQRQYFLGFHSTAGLVIIARDKIIFSVDNRYFSAARKRLSPKGIEVVLCNDFKVFCNYANEIGAKNIAIDFTKTTLSLFDKLKSFGFEYIDASAEIEQIMSVKTDEEIANISKACDIAERAWKAVLPFIKEGVSEKQVAAELEYQFKKFGASGPSFDTIVAFGKNAAVPHHETGDTKLRNNQCVLMDFGCVYNGYCSDMTRTMFYGKPDSAFLNAYKATYNAHMTAKNQIVSGMTGKEADSIARNVLIESGYGKYFTHSLGHGIGVNIHEYPTLSPKGEMKLIDGMVYSNEPGVYIDGKFGIRIEDSCHMKNGVNMSFMKDDKSLIVLGDKKIKKIKF